MHLYFIAWCTVMGVILGIAVWRVVSCVYVIRKYCEQFATPEKIIALAPDRTGGLGLLGHLSFDLDKAVSVPSITVLAYVSQAALAPLLHPNVEGAIGISFATGYLVALVYTAFLAVVFFIPLSPAHNAMLEAKNKSMQLIDTEFRKLYPSMVEEIQAGHKQKSEYFERAEQLYSLYERAKKMAVWPLNFGLISKYLLTAAIPIIGTFIVEVIVDLVLHWIGAA